MGAFVNYEDYGLMQLRFEKGLIVEKVYIIINSLIKK